VRTFRCLILLPVAAMLAACSAAGAVNPASPAFSPFAARAHSGLAPASGSGYQQLYVFKGTPDGASPFGGFVAINGTLYSTTLNGSKNYCSGSCGGNDCYLGCGTIFKVSDAGKEHVVYNFDGTFNSGHDGSWPFAGPTVVDGRLFGTTSGAGAYGDGTIYTSSTSGKERVLYSFEGGSSSDGQDPEAAMTLHSGKLYGTTVYGGGTGCGGYGCGTVFSTTTAGKEHVLYRFQGGSDGSRVYAGVTFVKDHIYGATFAGGTGCGSTGCGTIYVLNRGKESVIYRFTGGDDGEYPNGLTAVNGVLYGTTEAGGTKNSGTFFSIARNGSFKTLYNFTDIPDGNLPGANLIYSKGELYSTTVGGGTAGDGTVFEISTSGSESVLYSFLGGSDGSDPQGPLYELGGELYGTTTAGGNGGCTNNNGCGTIFKVSP
jgi:uncharacterized repeat protein (TIGR03803 family)